MPADVSILTQPLKLSTIPADKDTMNTPRTIILSLTAASALMGAAPAVSHSHPQARAVAAEDASYPGDFTATLRPMQSVTVFEQCSHDGFFTETQAYRSNGGRLGAQQWNRRGDLTFWRGRHGSVRFDGITFSNRTHAPVIVKGWCS